MQLVLQPCGDSDAQTHFVDTIENPVPLAKILPHLSPDQRAIVAATFSDAVAVWGVTPGEKLVNAKKWMRIELGDPVMLYRDKQFFFKGMVAFKVQSAELARELWGERKDGATWEYIFVLSDLEPIDVDVVAFNAAAGYKPTNIIQGFTVLPADKSERILEALELDAGVGGQASAYGDISAAKNALASIEGAFDLPASVRRRAEQRLLRKIFLGGKMTETCAICGRRLTVDLIVVGHIRKRHSCDETQKRDLANVMPICLLGCDSLFENGYITVDGAGKIREARVPDGAPELQTVVTGLEGRTCSAWSEGSEPYFQWHRQHPRRFV